MKIRLATRNTPLFDEEGLSLNERWREVDLDKLGLPAFAAVARYRGHFLQIHPEDAARFDEIVPRIEAAVEEQAKRDAAEKARADKLADKDEMSMAKRAISELRGELDTARRAANKNAAVAEAHARRADEARELLDVAGEQFQASQRQLAELQAAHEQLKAQVALTPPTNADQAVTTEVVETKPEPTTKPQKK